VLRFRAGLVLLTCALAFAAIRAGQGQTAGSPLVILEGLGLPAVEEGALLDEPRAPDTSVSLHTTRMQTGSTLLTRMGSSGAAYAPGKVLVKFRDGSPNASFMQAMRRVSQTARMGPRPAYADFDLVMLDPSEDPEAVAAAFRDRSDVEYAQAAYMKHPMFVPNDPLYKTLQWNLPLIDMERAWDIQPQAGSSITVAVLDTGVAYTNATVTATISGFTSGGMTYPALGLVTIPYSSASQLGASSRFVAPYDFIWSGTTPLDFDGHGTHVSGTIGQLTNDGIGTAGVAFNVKLMPVKVLASDWDVHFGGAPDVGGSDVEIVQGLRYAADNGAKIINMSLGGYGPPNCGTNPNQSGCSPAVEAALRYAVSKGAFVALAAGNGFLAGNPTSVFAEIASRVPGVVSVAAVGVDKSHAAYSSTGSWVELAAPGGGGGSDNSGFVWQQTFNFNYTDTFNLPLPNYVAPRFDVIAYVGYAGTSQATPHVAGVAAMLMQQGITSPAAIEAALERFATPCSESQNTCDASIAANHNSTFGYGLVDARNALRGLGLAR
jgi:serine protease